MSDLKTEKRIQFIPAYDFRSDPGGGIGSAGIRFTLKGALGAVDFSLRTGWCLPGSLDEPDFTLTGHEGEILQVTHHVLRASSRGYHSPKPLYEGSVPSEHCDLLPGGICYSDLGYRGADRIFKVLIAEGSDGVWRELEKYYVETFVKTGMEPMLSNGTKPTPDDGK